MENRTERERVIFSSLSYFGYDLGEEIAGMILDEYGFSSEEIDEQIGRNEGWLEMFAETYAKFGFTADELEKAIATNTSYYSSHVDALNKFTGTLINNRKNKWK